MFGATSPPTSPTKKSGFLLKMVTGVERVDTFTHQQRWGKAPKATETEPGQSKVKSMIQGYEEASLRHSKPVLPLAPTTPDTSANVSRPTNLDVRSKVQNNMRGSPSVPAAMFQQPNVRKTQGSGFYQGPTRASVMQNKENVEKKLPNTPSNESSSHNQNYRQPTSRPVSQSQQSDVSCATSTAHTDFNTESLISAENAVVGVAQIHRVHPHLNPPTITATDATPTKTQLAPKSSFFEALPVSFPLSVSQSNNRDALLTAREPLQESPRARRVRSATLGTQKEAPGPAIETPEQRTRRIEREFDDLLDTMQLSDQGVKHSMQMLTIDVKEKMLASQETLAKSTRGHTRTRSVGATSFHQVTGTITNTGCLGTSSSAASSGKSRPKIPFPGVKKTKSTSSLKGETDASSKRVSASISATSFLKSFGKGNGVNLAQEVAAITLPQTDEDPAWWAVRLRTTTREKIEIREVKVLRSVLRGESPKWVNEFIKSGGYIGLLERLKDVLEVEWREEQHDDQLLYELLRCVKALTLTSCGKKAIGERVPVPFVSLAALLFSEKRPGDLPCRQVLVELISGLYDIVPENSRPVERSMWTAPIVIDSCPPLEQTRLDFSNSSEKEKRYTRPMKDEGALAKTQDMVYGMMLGPPDEKEEAKVLFIKNSHKPRPFKSWVTELSDCARDYFWIFCHHNNFFWTYGQLDFNAIQTPKVPGGMTGGVEFEAMSYCESHLKLINLVAENCASREIAYAFHEDLYISGFDKILLCLRRASQQYYQTLHLAMSKYIELARKSGFNLGPLVYLCMDGKALTEAEIKVVTRYRESKYLASQNVRMPEE